MPEFIDEVKNYHPRKVIELWFQDESRFGNKTTLGHVWCDENDNPSIPIQNGFKNAYIFGAINPSSGDYVGFVVDGIDSDCMNVHLSLISKSIEEDHHAIIAVDGAGYHAKSSTLIIPENISLISLPPYSPELNPMENIWQWLKGKYLKNRIIKLDENLIDIGCEIWNKLTPKRVQSIGKGHLKMFSY